jgi:hypothetical protein
MLIDERLLRRLKMKAAADQTTMTALVLAAIKGIGKEETKPAPKNGETT